MKSKEDYVSLEVAEALEKKGCNLSSEKCYIGGRFTDSEFAEEADDVVVSAPSLYDVQKWLRVQHNIHVNADYEVYKEKWFFSFCLLDSNRIFQFEDMSESIYDSYESALNAGELDVLDLIQDENVD